MILNANEMVWFGISQLGAYHQQDKVKVCMSARLYAFIYIFMTSTQTKYFNTASKLSDRQPFEIFRGYNGKLQKRIFFVTKFHRHPGLSTTEMISLAKPVICETQPSNRSSTIFLLAVGRSTKPLISVFC